MERGENVPEKYNLTKGVISLKDFADSLIEFIDKPSVRTDELIDINEKVMEFFRLVNEANSVKLDREDKLHLYHVVTSFHKTVNKKYRKLKGKIFMADIGVSTTKEKSEKGTVTQISQLERRAEDAWKELVRSGNKATETQSNLKKEGFVAKKYGADFNLIWLEEEAKKACTRETAKDANVKISQMKQVGLPTEEEVKLTDEKMALIRTEFHSWYTGNYSQETGKVTLYRYVSPYPGFDRLLKGEVDLLPRGLIDRDEEKLLKKLKEKRQDLYDLYKGFLDGVDVSKKAIDWTGPSAGSFALDPSMYWTTSTRASSQFGFRERSYRIKIEVEPNKAFRSGGIDEKGNWIGSFDNELEWITLGRISKEAISEITDTKTGEIVYRRKISIGKRTDK